MNDYKYADLFRMDNVDKQFTIQTADKGITITNTELHQGKFELNESICSERTLRFGSCEASSVKFKISNIFSSLKSQEINVSCVLNNHTDEPFVFGKYKVDSDKPTADRSHRYVVAYDAMYDILNADVADWYNSLTFPMPLKTFRNAFISHFNLEEVEISLPNDEMAVERTIEPSEISGRDVITSICEINGCFGHISRDNKFEYIVLKPFELGLYPSNTLFPSDTLFPRQSNLNNISRSKYISASYEDYIVNVIDKIQIREEENDIGGFAGDGNNGYVVEDNFLVYGKSTEELNNIALNLLNAVKGIYYRPANIVAVGNPCLEVGDAIQASTKYQNIKSYILQRRLTGIQALKDSYSASGTEFYGNNINSVQKSIIQLKGKTNVLIRTVEETRSTLTDVESGLRTQILQNAAQINAEATRAIGAEQELSGRITLTAESFESQITGLNGDFTLLKQTVDGFTFKDENGETKITGNSIKSGTFIGVSALFTENNSLFWACGTTQISGAQSSGEWVCDSNALYSNYGGYRTIELFRSTGTAVFSGGVVASDVDIGYSVAAKISSLEDNVTESQTNASTALSEIAKTNGEVATLNTNVANLIATVNSLTARVSENESDIAFHDKSILGLETRLADVEEKLGL